MTTILLVAAVLLWTALCLWFGKRFAKSGFLILTITVMAICFMAEDSCTDAPQETKSASGVSKTSVSIPVGGDGLTTEQHNVRERLLQDNKPGAIKHLYVISPYSGQVILYSTVRGKVTSSGKRLTPSNVTGNRDGNSGYWGGFWTNIGGTNQQTLEVLGDDGTYGSSGDYLYWWDVRGAYHQQYLTGGQIITISDQPLPVKSVTINIEAIAGEK